jgi:26S proteasome regulatory subunit N13
LLCIVADYQFVIDLLHFCWKPRSSPEPEDDLIIIPGDARLVPYTECTTGRVMVLKFSSSSQRHFFWIQSKSESPAGELGHWSARDMKWVERINAALNGADDEDEEMGDIGMGSEELEEEGSASRRGGADGGRA